MALGVIQNNPNATAAVGVSPIAVGAVWLINSVGHFTFSPEVSAAVGSLSAAAVLFFFQGIRRTGSSIWELGIKGCCKQLWRGKSNASPS